MGVRRYLNNLRGGGVNSYATVFYSPKDAISNTHLINILDDVYLVIKDGEVWESPVEDYTFGDTDEHVVHFYFNPISTMNSLFQDCISATRITFHNFESSAILSSSYAFSGCSSLVYVDFSSFDFSGSVDMDRMFDLCSSLVTIIFPPIGPKEASVWDMFGSCAFKSIDLSFFKGTKILKAAGFLKRCSYMESADMSYFDTSGLEGVFWLFYYCRRLTYVKMINDVSSIVNADNMFDGITTTGVFEYNSAYDYSLIIAQLPSTWTAVPIEVP